MLYALDTEFCEDGRTIDLISIALVAEDGREFYLVSNEFNEDQANYFMQRYVLPQLPPRYQRRSRATIRRELLDFIGYDREPRFVANYSSYDWIALCQLFGTMMDLPDHFPMFCLDLQQELQRAALDEPPQDKAGQHDALVDARWLMSACREVGLR